MRRRIAIAVTLLLAALALAAGVLAVRLLTQDPLAALPRGEASRLAVVEERWERWEGRSLLHVTLDAGDAGRVRFVVSVPEPLPDRPVPLVVVLGGLETGARSVRELQRVGGPPGPNAFVGFDWPLPSRAPGLGDIALRVAAFRRAVLTVPGQVDAILAWATRQPWVDPRRVSLLGFSLGAFVLPASQRLAAQRGAEVRASVLGYAGAPIGDVVAGHPRAGPAWLRPALGATLDLLLRPVEPSLHLPHLQGTFLVLGGGRDQLIAPAAAERLAALTPEPRTVVRLEGEHMGVGPGQRALLARVIDVSRTWLLERGAIDPAAAPTR